MTLTQLESFVLVARLGSVKAAARALGVSEPAVSGALAALRQHLGDALIQRGTAGMELTPGGQRLIVIASQLVNLSAEAEAAIRQAQGAPAQLRVVATSTVAEYVAPSLVEAFRRRSSLVEPTVGVAQVSEMAAFLQERLADVALGPSLSGRNAVGIDGEPVMRYREVMVAAPGWLASSPAAHRPLSRAELAGCRWLVGPSGTDALSAVGMLLADVRVPSERVAVFPSHTAALAAAADGAGIAPAIAHLVAAELRRGTLHTVAAVGFPRDLLWHVSTLKADRRSLAASAFRRFLTTPEATQLMLAPTKGVPASRFRPPVYVTIWS